MAHGSIGDVPAATYAEYVKTSLAEQPGVTGAKASALAEEADREMQHALAADAPQSQLAHPRAAASPCIALRPSLEHRLYSHRLHVRAKAKLHRDRLLSGPMIDIYVGESRRKWSLHRNLLCHHSDVLEAELEGDAEGKDRKEELQLPEHDPAGFELLVKWLYQGKLDDVSEMADANQKYDYAVSCHKLYLLCDRFDMSQLKNVAMDQYRKGLNQAELVPDADEIDEVYRKSPLGSPFRQLMTQIAARQIMDPGSDRDVETYRQCFENNTDFAVDLVKAIKLGTGGMLFEDPTDAGNECVYHDHEAGPNCNIKGKSKVTQVKKTPSLRPARTSTKSTPSTSSDQPNLSRHLPLKTHPHLPPRQARPQDGISAGPLRRRLTSPASSTVSMSTEIAIATQPPSPDVTRDRERELGRLRKVTPPERLRHQQEQGRVNGMDKPESHLAQDDLHQSSESASLHLQNSATIEESSEGLSEAAHVVHRQPSRRGIWEWARAGTGRLNIMGRLPHPEWNGPATGKISTDLTTSGISESWSISESRDDFSIPSTTASQLETEERQAETAAAKAEGFGISHIISPSFSQTKRSSDELVAASSTASTPAHQKSPDHGNEGEVSTPSAVSRDSPPSTPDTPTPQQRKRDKSTESDRTQLQTTPSKDSLHQSKLESEHEAVGGESSKSCSRPPSSTNSQRILKYKVALASDLLSPARSTAST